MSDFDDDFLMNEDAEDSGFTVIDGDVEEFELSEVQQLERALELAREREAKPNRAQRRSKEKRSGTTPPAHAPKPQDRQSKKLAQQDEAEDAEIVIAAFGDTFRVRRSSLQDNWKFFAASAVGNLPSMLASMLGNNQFVRFCQKAMEAGMKPNEAAAEMMSLISAEMGVGDSGNS